jgi:hypothetical protein
MLSLSAEGINIRRRPLGRLSMALLIGMGLAMAAILIAGAAFLGGRLVAPLLTIAAVVAGATLVGAARFRAASAERAVFAMTGGWAVILLLAAGCVVPLCEPGRTSRVVGERLAELSRRQGIEPVLLEYQEPGVIYAMGHPVTLTRDRDGFFAHVAGSRSVATVLLDFEIPVMRSHFGLDVTLVDQIESLELTKGKRRILYLAVVKEGPSRGDERPANVTARRDADEQTLVK